jgi:hypothetical protein
VLFAASAFAACSDAGDEPAASGAGAAADAAGDRVNSSAGAGGKHDLMFDAAPTDASEIEPDVAPADAGEQPVVACSMDGGLSDALGAMDTGTSAECEPPPSRCADNRFLVYYRDGTCVDGRCQWREELYRCAYSCLGNGCNGNFTAPAAP